MTLQKIEFEYDIPDGYRFVRYASANKGDACLANGKIIISQSNYMAEFPIVEKIPQSTKRHKHADLIHAWAEGAEIQYFHKDQLCWTSVIGNDPSWFDDTQYRIKPKTKTVRFRNYLTINNFIAVSHMDNPDYFVKWLGDWQEAEVEE